jgi:hypothetical protein
MLQRLLSAARTSQAVRLMRQGWAALARLPFRYIVCLDTEFRTKGNQHRAWCLCGVELRSGQEFRIWLDGRTVMPPFLFDASTLFVAFVAGAEVASMRVRGWPMPQRIFDLYQEHRILTNTGRQSDPKSLEDACLHYGLAITDHITKKYWQTEAAESLDWPPERQEKLTEYCFEDGLATARVFLCTWAVWMETFGHDAEFHLHHALRRGLYAGVLAEAELRGIKFHAADWATLRDGRDSVFDTMVESLDPVLRPCYRHSKHGYEWDLHKFTETMASIELADHSRLTDHWQRTPKTGQLSTTDEMLDEMLIGPPERLVQQRLAEPLTYLAEVMRIRRKVALLQYDVGEDGRARTPFFPSSLTSGRNCPKAAKYLFNAPKMFRHLMGSELGKVVVAFDYRAEETMLWAGLAGCSTMVDIYETEEDIHLGCAKRAKQAPPDATLKTHKPIRQVFKICNFRLAYGSSVRGLAAQLGSMGKAQYFHDLHRATFPECHAFQAGSISYARTHTVVELPDGWRKLILPPFRSTVAANFPIQATAAGVLRRAVLDCYRAGLPLIATVHDSLVFEVPIADVEALVRTVIRIMGDASEWFVPGLRLKVDVSASEPLQHLGHLNISQLADPTLRTAYDLVLMRAGQRQRG